VNLDPAVGSPLVWPPEPGGGGAGGGGGARASSTSRAVATARRKLGFRLGVRGGAVGAVWPGGEGEGAARLDLRRQGRGACGWMA
jgi:hypothetical protein